MFQKQRIHGEKEREKQSEGVCTCVYPSLNDCEGCARKLVES